MRNYRFSCFLKKSRIDFFLKPLLIYFFPFLFSFMVYLIGGLFYREILVSLGYDIPQMYQMSFDMKFRYFFYFFFMAFSYEMFHLVLRIFQLSIFGELEDFDDGRK